MTQFETETNLDTVSDGSKPVMQYILNRSYQAVEKAVRSGWRPDLLEAAIEDELEKVGFKEAGTFKFAGHDWYLQRYDWRFGDSTQTSVKFDIDPRPVGPEFAA